MVDSQKALMDKSDALLALQPLITPRTRPETVEAMKHENSSISDLNRRNDKQKQKKIVGGAIVIVIKDNRNIAPAGGQPAANLNLGAKAP